MKNFIYISFWILLGQIQLQAQGLKKVDTLNNASISVKIDTVFMLMGDHNALHLDMPLGFHKSIDFSLLDTMETADFEVLKIDSTHEGSRLKYDVAFTIWKPGKVETPRIPIIYGNDIQSDTTYLEPINLYVNPPYIDTTRAFDSLTMIQLIKPIKDIKDEPLVWNDYKLYVYILGLLLLVGIGILLYYFFKRPKPVEEVPEVIIPAHVIALNKFKEIKDKKLWTEGDDKNYYSALTYVIREYLENRYRINALESTTKEVLNSLKDRDFSKEHINDLKTMLNLADMIKFAKAKAPESEHLRLLNIGIKLVEETKEVVIEGIDIENKIKID